MLGGARAAGHAARETRHAQQHDPQRLLLPPHWGSLPIVLEGGLTLLLSPTPGALASVAAPPPPAAAATSARRPCHAVLRRSVHGAEAGDGWLVLFDKASEQARRAAEASATAR
jgi:hypothetical protein